jgi:hypothetical protein
VSDTSRGARESQDANSCNAIICIETPANDWNRASRHNLLKGSYGFSDCQQSWIRLTPTSKISCALYERGVKQNEEQDIAKTIRRATNVNPSYLSQVRHAIRPPSAKLSGNTDVMRLPKTKHDVDVNTSKSYNLNTCQRSSGVEQRFRKPPVVGSNPTAGWG